MVAARKIDLTQEAPPSAAPAPSPPLGKARVARLRRKPVFPPAAVTHRRPIEPEPVTPDPDRLLRLRYRTGLLVQLFLAEEREQREEAELAHARFLGADDRAAEDARKLAKAGGVISRPDRGAAGAAMTARPSVVQPVDPDDAADVRQMLDADPLELMGLSNQQLEAAAILSDTYRDAALALEMPRGFGDGSAGGARHVTHDQYLAAQQAWKDYQLWLGMIEQRAGARHATAVRDAVILKEPASIWCVRDGLDVLVHHWDLR